MNECGNLVLVLGQKAGYGMGRVRREQICVLKAQIVKDGAVENHVKLIINARRRTSEACAFMAGGLEGLWQVAFPFDAKMVATGPETAHSNAMLAVCDFKHMG